MRIKKKKKGKKNYEVENWEELRVGEWVTQFGLLKIEYIGGKIERSPLGAYQFLTIFPQINITISM